MADNKKKPNYADALRAQAKKLAASEEEFVMLEDQAGGEPTKLFRGKGKARMDDAAWERLKQRADVSEGEGSSGMTRKVQPIEMSVDVPSPERTKSESDAYWKDFDAQTARRKALEGLPEIEGYRYGPDSLIPDKDTHALLKKLGPKDRVKYFEDRLKKLDFRDEQNAKQKTEDDQLDSTINKAVEKLDAEGVSKKNVDSMNRGAEKAQPGSTTTVEPPGKGNSRTVDANGDTLELSRNEPGMSVRGQMGRLATSAAPGTFKGFDDLKKDQGSPEADFSAAPNQAGKTVNDAVDRAQLPASKGSGMMMPELNIAPEGLDPRGSNPKLNEMAARQMNSKSYQFKPAIGETTAVDPADDPPQPGLLDTINNEATGLRDAIVDVVNPVGTGISDAIGAVSRGAGEIFDAGGPLGALPPAVRGGPGPVAMVAPQPGQPSTPVGPPGSGSASVSVSGRVPGGAPNLKAPDFKEQQRMIQEGYTTQNMANALMAEQQSDLLTKKADLVRQQQDESAQLAARQASMESARAERMKRGAAGLASLQTRLADLENQAPDPNRFWNNKDAGQKAAAVIAGALFGFTGQGMQWLQRLDGLVERDIQQQAAELQRKGNVLGKQIDVQNNLVAMARQEGLDESESISAARAMMLNKYALQFEAAAATTGSEQVKAQALANAGILRQKMGQEQADMMLKTSKAAQDAALAVAEIAQRNAQTYAARVAAAGGGKKDGLQDQKPVQQERLAELNNVADTLGQMWGDYQKLATSPIPGKPGLTSVLPKNISDSSLWDGPKREEYTQLIGKPIEGGVVREEDTKRYKESYIPAATDTERVARAKVDTLINLASTKYRNEYNTQAQSGVRMAPNTPTPEQFEAKLRARTFAGAPPASVGARKR
jgi:hypothetical protein